MWTSVPQIPVRNVLISTSLIPIFGTGISSSHNPGSRLLFTSAFTIITIARFVLEAPRGEAVSERCVAGFCELGLSSNQRKTPRSTHVAHSVQRRDNTSSAPAPPAVRRHHRLPDPRFCRSRAAPGRRCDACGRPLQPSRRSLGRPLHRGEIRSPHAAIGRDLPRHAVRRRGGGG